MDKTNIIVYSSIGLLVVGMAIYTVSVFSEKEVAVEKDFSVPDIVLEDSKSDYESRLSKASAYHVPEKEIDVSKELDFQVYQPDTTDIKPVVKEKPVVYNPPVKQSKKKQPKTTPAPLTTTETKTDIPASNIPEPDPYTNIGITTKKQVATTNNTVASNLYYDAFLLSDTKIKNGSQLVFILSKDSEISGIKFRKMSRIFAVASYTSNNVDVVANMIQNTDGKKYPISVIGYNENYQKGIFNNSKIDNAVNEGTEEFANDAVAIPTSSIQFVSSVLNATGKATKEAFKKEPEIFISEGYRMYFKSE